MSLKYEFNKLFRGRFPSPKILYAQLEDLQRQIEDGADAIPVVKENIKLTKSSLKKAFGKRFNNVGVIHNEEGSYIVIANGDDYKYVALEDL